MLPLEGTERYPKPSGIMLVIMISNYLQITTLSLTLKGTKPPPKSVEGLDVQRNALQHLAAIVVACAPTLKAIPHPMRLRPSH